MDRSGKREGTVGTPAGYQNPRLSPNGKRLAVFKPEDGGDIYVTELEAGTFTRFTSDPADDNVPLWSPDSPRIAFVSNRDGGVFNIYQKNAGGTGPEELLLKTAAQQDSQRLVARWALSPVPGRGPTDEEDRRLDAVVVRRIVKASPLLNNPLFNESEATFSPDGRWIAYTSDEDGSRQVFVQSSRPRTGSGECQPETRLELLAGDRTGRNCSLTSRGR